MTRRMVALAALGLVASAACNPSVRVTELCSVAPSVLTASARTGSPRRLTVHGERFVVCRDTNRGPQVPAMRAIALVLQQGAHRVSLGTVDAHGRHGTFTVAVPVPAEFAAGAAVVTASGRAVPVTLP